MFIANFHEKYQPAVQTAINMLNLNKTLYISKEAYDDFGIDLPAHYSLHTISKNIDLENFDKTVQELCRKMILTDNIIYN